MLALVWKSPNKPITLILSPGLRGSLLSHFAEASPTIVRLLFLVAIVSNCWRLPHRTLPAVLPSIMWLKVLQLSFVAWLFKILANIDFIQIKQSALLAVNNWLPLPYTVQAVSIIAVKCSRNLTQKSFDIMFQWKNTPFFSLSVSLFSWENFCFMKRFPKCKQFSPLPKGLWLTQSER